LYLVVEFFIYNYCKFMSHKVERVEGIEPS